MFLTKYRAKDLSCDTDFFPMFKWFDDSEKNHDFFRVPRTNVNETDKAYILTMEMPGIAKKEVNVAVENDHVVVTAERTEKYESEGLLRREIRSEKFQRSFRVDATIDADGVKAKLENGILKVTLPKKADSVGRKITVD